MKEKIISHIFTMLTASFAFISALAWNDAVQSIFNQLDYFQDKSMVARFIYAIFITVLFVFISTLFTKYLNEDNK